MSKTLCYGKKLVNCAIGSIIEVTKIDEECRTSYDFIEKSCNDERIYGWSMAERAFLERRKIQAVAKKKCAKDIDSLLDKLIQASHKLSARERIPLASYVHQCIILGRV